MGNAEAAPPSLSFFSSWTWVADGVADEVVDDVDVGAVEGTANAALLTLSPFSL